MIRCFSGNDALNCTQNEWRSRLVLALSEGRQYGSTHFDDKMKERIEVAIASLTMAMVEDIERCYAQNTFKVDATIQKSFTIKAPDSEAARRKIEDSVRENGGMVTDAKVEAVHG